MKIASSNVLLSSQQVAVAHTEVKESLRMWVGDQRPDFEGRERGRAIPPGRLHADAVHLSSAAQQAQPSKQVADDEAELSPEDEQKMALLMQMIEMMTGKKIKLVSPRELSEGMQKAQEQTQETTAALQKAQHTSSRGQAAPAPPERAGYGVEYDYYERHYEAEKTTFAAEGVIQTQDGKTIEFSVNLSMSREFMREQSVSVREGDARMKDPLVLNFAGNAAELTSTRFDFDIDSDGRPDQIAFVGSNSGFLALDRNNDGKINDGRELFGASTGAGFAELAAYDQDGNQWIDENDAIYQNLRIWSKDGQGNDQLVGLGERGVGAIYLGHVTSPFALKDSNNALLGQIRESGVFLNENGTVGTVQKIDLAV